MDLQLAGKRAVVTGGSRGIGKATARLLATEGCAVALIARTEPDVSDAAAEIAGQTGGRVVSARCDTGDDDQVHAAFDDVVAALGGVDVLVNCAAIRGGERPAKRTQDITADAFWPDVNVKVLGYLRCAQAVIPHMREQGWGRIINLGGLAARSTGAPITSMRNVAVASLTKNLADELGGDGINVTVVHPSITWTEATPGMLERRAEAAGRSVEEVRADLERRTTIGRMVTADEVAQVITFLASPLSSAITGDAIPTAGGVRSAIYY